VRRRANGDDDGEDEYDVILIPVTSMKVQLSIYLSGSNVDQYCGVVAESHNDTDTELMKDIIRKGKLAYLNLDLNKSCRLMYERKVKGLPLYIVPPTDIRNHIRRYAKSTTLYFVYHTQHEKGKTKPDHLTIAGSIGFASPRGSSSRRNVVTSVLEEGDPDTDDTFGNEEPQSVPDTASE
jgi:hypothetical protein